MFYLFLQATSHVHGHNQSRSAQLANLAMSGNQGLHALDEIISRGRADPTLENDIEDAIKLIKEFGDPTQGKNAIFKLELELKRIRDEKAASDGRQVLPAYNGAPNSESLNSETESEERSESQYNEAFLALKGQIRTLLRRVDHSETISPEEISQTGSTSEYIVLLLVISPESVADYVKSGYDAGVGNDVIKKDLEDAIWIVEHAFPTKSSQRIAVVFLKSLIREGY